jgi:hypothetical protein
MTEEVGESEKDGGGSRPPPKGNISPRDAKTAEENDFADREKLRGCRFFLINIAPCGKKIYVTVESREIVKGTGPQSAYLVYISNTIVNCSGS